MSARRIAVAFALGLTCLGAALAVSPMPGVVALQERGFDALMAASPQSDPALADGAAVHVVEIGRQGADGGPWGRDDLALLLDKIAQTGPRVIGIDMVLAGGCGPDPVPDAATMALGHSLTKAAGVAPVVLGFLLSDQGGAGPDMAPTLAVMQGAPAWRAEGAEMPCPLFAQSVGRGAALIALAGDGEGRIRSIPAAVFVAGRPFAGLAVEVARLAQSLPPPILGQDAGARPQGWLRLGDQTVALNEAGEFRIAATNPTLRAVRRYGALDLITAQGPDLPPGAIILMGSALPEAGGLRPTRISPLHPSVHLHADAIEQILTRTLPQRSHWAPMAEAMAAVAAGLIGLALGQSLAPVMASLATVALATIWVGALGLVARLSGQLIDPIVPVATLTATAALTLLAEAMRNRRTAQALGARMRRHLPASVVAILSRGDEGAGVTAEYREITALFTDIEGFSAMTARLPPETLVALLDRYMTGVTGLVEQHGGMVDKIVGDAVHALFNAPESLPDHVTHAITCATAISAFTEALRHEPDMQAAGFGGTRIGLEAGQAILGDIGRGGRVDYTAHGTAVNLAARLQEANKMLGTRILIGPEAARRAPDAVILGPEIELRSFGRLRVSFPVGPTTGTDPVQA